MENKGINKQFYICFFEKKHVELQKDIFLTYYRNIFPCPHLFVEFLMSNNREQQLMSAKKIIKRVFFGTDNSNLQNLFDELINLEESNLVEQDNSFYPRDHAVHSINTYLLGIYLFFFSQTFNKQLNAYFSKKEFDKLYDNTPSYNAFLTFLDAWKLFAFNHDIGYPFEILINFNGEINEKSKPFVLQLRNGLKNAISTEYAIYELQFLTCLSILETKSVSCLSNSLSKTQYENLKIRTGRKTEYSYCCCVVRK